MQHQEIMHTEEVRNKPQNGNIYEYKGYSEPDLGSSFARCLPEQHVYYSYVCLKPSTESVISKACKLITITDDQEVAPKEETIQIGKSKALHELVESHRQQELEANKNHPLPTTSIAVDNNHEQSEDDDTFRDPNILKLTKMKWLSEENYGVDSRSPTISPSLSTRSSYCSLDENETRLLDDKYLSTIIQLDKEYNLFGISNLAIEGSRVFKKSIKDDRPLFPQNAIVQICCRGNGCCKHKSNTDMPTSLKCGGCHSCCGQYKECRSSVCGTPCNDPCEPLCPPKKTKRSCCGFPLMCDPVKCPQNCHGFMLTVTRKPIPEVQPKEIYPKGTSVLVKPLSARPCEHNPRCSPPSPCFPFLMPCFWPSPKDSPCSEEQCFHNPRCSTTKKLIPKQTESKGVCKGCPKQKCSNRRCSSAGKIKKDTQEQKTA